MPFQAKNDSVDWNQRRKSFFVFFLFSRVNHCRRHACVKGVRMPSSCQFRKFVLNNDILMGENRKFVAVASVSNGENRRLHRFKLGRTQSLVDLFALRFRFILSRSLIIGTFATSLRWRRRWSEAWSTVFCEDIAVTISFPPATSWIARIVSPCDSQDCRRPRRRSPDRKPILPARWRTVRDPEELIIERERVKKLEKPTPPLSRPVRVWRTKLPVTLHPWLSEII